MTDKKSKLDNFGILSPVMRLKGERGTAGVEFAIVLPMMILAFVGSFSVFQGVRASRLISQASTTVVDLVTRQAEMTDGSFTLMASTAEAIVGSFVESSSLDVTVTSILNPDDEDDALDYEVQWSLSTVTDGELETSDLAQINLPGIAETDTVILVSVKGRYKPKIAPMFVGPMLMKRTAIRRPRFSQSIAYVPPTGD